MTSRPRVLITGATGFSGRWLIDHLRRGPPATIIGLGTSAACDLPLDAYLPCDVGDLVALEQAVAEARAGLVFHLAGRNAFSPAEEIERVNVAGFDNLCRALRAWARSEPVRLITIGSAAELGSTAAARLPVDEAAPCAPESPYGRSKWAATQRALAMQPDERLHVIVARPFNLVGPGLDARLALGSFAAQLAAAARGETSEVRCGSLETRRDYVDVRDAVAAYAALAQHGRPGQLYHVCRGRSYRLGDLLDQMIALAGVSVRVVVEASRRRAGDLPDIYGSHARLTAATGWQPRIAMAESLADMLAHACAVTRSAGPAGASAA
jgi:nucleoside-diphosphate-sugar epimerase